MTSPFIVKEHVVPGQYVREYARATSGAQEEVLELAVKEYVPRETGGEGDVTIIGAHANGFPKELYEPLWEDLLGESKKQGFQIRSIIIADAAWQGKSGQLNASKLGNDPSWLDYARDINQIINHLRPPLPLVGIAHSFGAAALANLAHFHPRLLTSLILLDPVISPYASTPGPISESPAAFSLRRRELWTSRSEAQSKFEKNPFYKAWDPRVLDRWMEFGIRDVKEGEVQSITGEEGNGGEVTLSTTKHQENFTFFRPSHQAYNAEGKELIHPELVPDIDPSGSIPNYPFYRPEPSLTLSRLPTLRPSVLYIRGGTSNISTPEVVAECMRLTGQGRGGSRRAENVMLEGCGHLVPMEAPGECARFASGWVGREVRRWWEGEGRRFEEWKGKSVEEKTKLGPDWYEFIKREKPKL